MDEIVRLMAKYDVSANGDLNYNGKPEKEEAEENSQAQAPQDAEEDPP